MDPLILVRRQDQEIINKKDKKKKRQRNSQPFTDFAVQADHSEKLKEGEKRNKYLDLVRGLKRLWRIKVTVISVIVGALKTISKGLKKGL